MSTTGWVCAVAATATSTGNIKQLYPVFCPAGGDPATAGPGTLVRGPCEGELVGLQVQTDGTNGGLVEIWDVNGADAGADVSQSTTITQAQMTTLIAAGKARLLYSQNVLGTGETPPPGTYFRFLKGLAARFSNSGPTGTVNINANVGGGYRLIHGSH